MTRISVATFLLIVAVALSSGKAIAGQGAGRMLYTAPNTAFVMQRSGETLVAINDASGSIATLQTAINNARIANPTNVIVIRLTNTIYTVSSAGLVLTSRECLIASGATIKAANASVTVPLITIASGSTNVSVAGGTLDGSGANIQGIYAPAAARVNIDKVTVQNCGQDCILLKGQGNSTYDNEMTVTRCDMSGSPAHAGISVQNSTQTIVADNNSHDNLAGIYLSCAWAVVANNACHHNTTGIEIAGGSDNVIANNTCHDNATGIRAGASNNMITSNSTGNNSIAGINSNGSSNTFVDNLFTAGNAAIFASSSSGNRVVAYKAPLSASGQNYFYPPLIDDQHTNTIVNGMGRTDLTIGSSTIASVQSQSDAARAANPNNVIVLHLNGTFTVGSSPLNLASNTCVLLNGTIQINASTTASSAIHNGTTPARASISGGIIDGGNLTGNNGVSFSSSSMIQLDQVTLQNFGPSSPRSGGSDVVHFSGGSTPYIVTRCKIDGGSSRGIWLQLNGPKSVISDNEVTDVNQDGVDCDSTTKGCVAKYNYCHDLVRYGVFIEQSASYNQAFGNICNNAGRDINLYNNYATYRAPVQYNTVAFNWCYGNNGIRNGSTGTNTTVTSHNFLFNNTVISASINSELEGAENYYSQNYHVGTLNTAGVEVFFNSARVSTNSFMQDDNSGLAVLVQNAATTNGAAVVIGAPGALENDLWALIPTDSAYCQIRNKNSGRVMAVPGASTNSGAAVIQWSFGSGKNDQWMPVSAGNGLWYFVNRLSGLCLTVSGAGTLPGTQLVQQPNTGGANQQFNLPLNAPSTQLPFFLSAAPLTQTINPGGATNYTVTLATNTGFAGPVGFVVSGLPANATANFAPPSLSGPGASTLSVTTSNNTPAGSYALTIQGTNSAATNSIIVALVLASPGSNLVWNSTSSTAWDTNTANWFNEQTSAADLFQPGKSVRFTDWVGVVTNVTIASGVAVAPGAVVVDADGTNYTITGAGKITGATSLVKSGAGTLTLGTANDFTGKTIVQGGVLSISTENNLGGNPGALTTDQLTLDGGTLQTAVAITLDDSNRGITLGDNGGTFAITTNTTTIVDLIHGGSLTKAGDGTLALNSANDYAGGSTVTAGGLRANALGAYGSGLIAVSGSGVAYLNAGGTYTNDFDIASIGSVEATGNFGAIRFANNSATATTLTGTITVSGDSRMAARGIAYSNPGAMISGRITGDSALEFGNSGATTNPGRITLLNPDNNWAGDTTISHGTLRLGAANVIPNGVDFGNVILNNSNPTNDSALDLNGFNETINGLSTTGSDFTRCLVTNSSASAATLTLGDNDAGGAFGGSIKNGAGIVALTKIGAGTHTLSGASAYTGPTVISNGTLVVNGSLANSSVTVLNGAALGGAGMLGGTLSVLPGGTVSPGNSIGLLTLNNNVTLQGTTLMELDASAQTNDVLRSVSNISYGGTLRLTNLSGTLTVSDSFKLFDAASYSGGFTKIVPAIPGFGLGWNTNTLGSDGVLRIVSVPTPQPAIASVSVSGSSLNVSGTNGVPGWTYWVLTSTNLALPAAQWTPAWTNTFDSTGAFNFSRPVDPDTPEEFFLLQLQ